MYYIPQHDVYYVTNILSPVHAAAPTLCYCDIKCPQTHRVIQGLIEITSHIIMLASDYAYYTSS